MLPAGYKLPQPVLAVVDVSVAGKIKAVTSGNKNGSCS